MSDTKFVYFSSATNQKQAAWGRRRLVDCPL